MKKHGIGGRLLALLLVLAMVLPMVPMQASAAVGDTVAGDTGLSSDIDTSDVISLPIKIYDYNADGMLFEYAETQASTSENVWLRAENVSKPTATVKTDFTLGNTSYGAVAYSSATYTSGAAVKGNTDTMKWLKWAKDSSDSACLSVFDRTAEGYGSTLYKISAIRYLALVYRSTGGTASDTAQFDMWDKTANVRTSKVTVTYDNRGTTWRYMIVDLGDTGATLSDYVTAVYGYLPAGTGVAFAGYFSTEAAAKAYGEAALEYTGETYHYAGDNRAYGLLRYSRTTAYGANSTDDNISTKYADAGITMVNTYGDATELDVSTLDLGYDYTLHGLIGDSGIATLGMLQPDLGSGRLPVYREETVTYVAELLRDSLAIPEVDSSTGYKNYQFVQGVAEERYGNIDLAQWLRNHCTSLGTYNASSQKNLVGKWEDVSGNITTWYDAAYFMLNSIFVSGSYNTYMDDYDYLVLSAATNSDGKKIYVFDGGFATSATPSEATSAVKYDETENTIQNSSGLGKTRYYYDEVNTESTTTYYPFLPIVDENGNNTNGVTESEYFLDPGVASNTTDGNTYVNRNYNYVLASQGEFTFYADDELYFNFEGDDDVYLFIDGKLVLDIGGAHSITSYKLNINDYADTLGLIDGDTYAFDFFYMERHGVGANMRIETNIRVTNPAMTTEKTAYQDGNEIEYGGIVNASGIVEYGFSITNNGEENLYNIGFTDDDIGIKLDPENGLTITGDRVYALDGTRVTQENRDKLFENLTVVLSGENKKTRVVYDPITITFANNDELIHFLQNITSAQALDSGAGLWIGSTVAFRGIGYKLSDEQVKSGWFDNTVHSVATNLTASKTLKGEDTMRVCIPSDPMYYQWAGHNLVISKDKFIADITAAAAQQGNTLAGKVPDLTAERVTNVVEVTKGGYAHDYAAVTINSDFSLTVNYNTVGSHVFYVKVYYKVTDTNWPSVVIPVVVNVTDVKDSVFVLDYGLKAELTGANSGGINELLKNDTLSVPGRDTEYSFLGLGSDGAYSPNEITFTKDEDGVIVSGSGTYTLSDKTLTYLPTDFMDTLDTIQLAVNVYEKGITPSAIGEANDLDINNEVEMYKNVTVLPATVVYYEDDFPAIEYITQEKNTFTRLGESTDESQGVDQEENYGHDDTYADDSNTDMSAGTLTTITIGQEGPVAKFTFKGTGFELISRTNAYDSATLDVAVFAGDVDVTYEDVVTAYGTVKAYRDKNGNEPIRLIPVITEFDNGGDGGTEEIYQVPVIRVDDLDLGTYTVVIGGVPAYDWDNVNWDEIDTSVEGWESNIPVIPTKLYIDGLRIYQPLGATNVNYDTDENGAEFKEIRDLIVDGSAAVAKYNGTNLTVGTATTTWTENRNGKYYDDVYEDVDDIPVYEGNVVDNVNAYLLMGPNNEVYMDGTIEDAALAFYVVENGSGEHQLQIAVHAVDQGLFYGSNSTGMHAPIYYGVKSGDTYTWEPLVTTYSGTEQYYTIDYAKCPTVSLTVGGASIEAYQVMLKVDIDGSEYATAMASYTSLKLTNMALLSMNRTAATLRYNNGVLEEYVDGAWVPVIDEEEGDGTSTAAFYPAFEALSAQMRVGVTERPQPDPDPKPDPDPEPKPDPVEPENPFTDVKEGAFYYKAMLWAVESGITNGTTSTTFSPDKNVTRAEAVTFLWRAAGKPEPVTQESEFVDINEKAFYYKAVLWAVENGITKGMDATHFAPQTECSRAQVVTFLYRAAGKPEVTGTEHPFTDVSEKAFYYQAMLWAVENGITSGLSATHFGPDDTCTRAQVVTFLYRAQ